MGACLSTEAGNALVLPELPGQETSAISAVCKAGEQQCSSADGIRTVHVYSDAALQGPALIQQVKTVLASLSAIPANGFAETCTRAADVLLKELQDAATVGITTYESGCPSICVLAGAAGVGAHLLQQQLAMSGSSWSPCLCCSQMDRSFLYRTVIHAEDAQDLPQDWAALHQQCGLRTFLAVQITVGGQDTPIGVLYLASQMPGAFMDESWGLLLSMVCTGLVPLLTSPWLSGLSGLAASLIESSSGGFSAFVAAFLVKSAQLLQSTTHRQLGVRLGLISPDGQDVLLLHHSSSSSSSSRSLYDADQADQGCDYDAPSAALSDEHSFGSFGSFQLGLPQLQSTRLAAAHTMLADALRCKQERFVADAAAFLENEEAGSTLDMLDIGLEVVASMAVVPLYGPGGKAIGGLYVTSDKPGNLLQGNSMVQEQVMLLQGMLQQQLVALPSGWEELQPRLSSSTSSVRSEGSIIGPSTPTATCPLPTQHSAKLALLQEVWALQDKQQERASDYLDELELYNVLGHGGFSTVYAGIWQGSRTAIKVMRVSHNDKLCIPIKSAMEMATLSTLRHPNIVTTYACLTDMVEERRPRGCISSCNSISGCGKQPLNVRFRKATPSDLMDSRQDTYNIVVMERCSRGNLWQAVKQGCLLHRRLLDGRLKINMRLLYTVLLDVAQSLKYLHSMGLVHCDIKAENVLLATASSRPNGFVCKLGDFGLVKMLGDKAFLKNTDTSGTLTHLAPERFQTGGLVSTAVDSYSFGILMYELYSACKPYKGMLTGSDLARAVFQGMRPQFPSSTPSSYKQLAKACWSASITDRPNFDQIVQQLQVHLLLRNLGCR